MDNSTNQNRNANQGTFERVGEQIGGATGNLMGRGAEIAGDMMKRGAGIAGSMMGSMVDTVMNTLGGWWTTRDAGEAAQSFNQAEPTCRQHFESQSSSGMENRRDYDDVRPFYQFGYVASRNPGYQGRDFSQVEPELERAWQRGSRPEDWSEVRGYVDFGYRRDRSDSLNP